VLAVRRALELGAHGIEVDVHFVDGELIVIHDDTLGRTTNGQGRVAGKSLAYLRSLDAGKGELMPTLREIFEAVNHRAFINIELKGCDTAAPVQSLIEEYANRRGWRQEHFLVSSFDHKQLSQITNRNIRIGILFPRAPLRFTKLAAKLHAWSIHTPVRSTRRPLVTLAHEHGLKVFAYTANSMRSIHRLRAIGVDGVFTDFPERVSE
jgi:glycerophosphoryl diester phosphodiesterase